MGTDGVPELSVVIPSYNSIAWLPSTLAALEAALIRTSWTAEVIVIDDGSSDGSGELLHALAQRYGYPLIVLTQSNQGRFLARWAGLQAARAENVLFLDSRVLLEEQALAHIERERRAHPFMRVWNGHAITDPQAPLLGHFWEVPVHIVWGGYLAHPRPTQITVNNYNRFPKGTGVFFAPRKVLVDACRSSWPSGHASLASDDTKVLRSVAAAEPIRLDPGFCAIYRPRTSVWAFIAHSFGRGTFLVDSFGGTSRTWNSLIALAVVLPPITLLALVLMLTAGSPIGSLILVLFCVALILLPAGLAAFRGCSARGVLSYLSYVLLFTIPYWAGLVRGVRVHGYKLLHVTKLPEASAS